MRRFLFIKFFVLYFVYSGIVFFSTVVLAQSGLEAIDPGLLMGHSASNMRYPRSERAVDDFQETFIYHVLTKQMFKESSYFEDGTEDDNLFSNQQSKQFINELLARKIAADLARKDVLKLKVQLRKQMGM